MKKYKVRKHSDCGYYLLMRVENSFGHFAFWQQVGGYYDRLGNLKRFLLKDRNISENDVDFCI